MTDQVDDAPLIHKVMQDIKDRIAQRHLTAGSRLPSLRAQADNLSVSKSTVVNAYEKLVAEGVIEARPGSGFYVSEHSKLRTYPTNTVKSLETATDQAIDPVWVMRHSLERDEQAIKPGCGWLPESWMPTDEIRKGLRSLSRQDVAPLTGYGTPQGLPALRQLLANRISERGINASGNNIMLTESGTQALDLICRYLLNPGDVVVVDDPCFFSFQAMLRAHRATVVTVPYTPQGPDIDQFEQCLIEHRPRLYLTNAALHNPTGASLSLDTAHRLLILAERHDLTIIEDDVFADFEWRPSPRLAAMDGLNRVIHTGSFSKTLSASVRVGYIATHDLLLKGLVDLKLATAFESGHFSAQLLHHLLSNGAYRKHIEGLRKRLSHAMNTTLDHLRGIGMTPWIEPRGGMFVWAKLPDGVDAEDVTQKALKHQILLAPGNVFSASDEARRYMRFNVAQCQPAQMFMTLGKIIEDIQTESASGRS